MPVGQPRAEGWERLTADFPDKAVIFAIRGIYRFGARIGYKGICETPTIYPNLSTAEVDIPLVTSDITSEMSKNRLLVYRVKEALPIHYTASPPGLTDKADGSKRRIHHLSYPALDTDSINGGIPEHYGTIIYSGISDAIQAIQYMGKNCLLVKRDFESAFRHIPVSPLDSPLLGFHWKGTYYAESFLPFGLRTAPYLFNLFAEVFHWILEEELKSLGLRVRILHYLDDFLMVLPPESSTALYTTVFTNLCHEVGLSIKDSKNEQGMVASFAGVEFDTSQMLIRLPAKKLLKAQSITQRTPEKKSVSLLELQKITGYLNFVATVVPLGRTFLRRLYNMELHFPPGSGYHKRRLSSEAREDLAWWTEILSQAPYRSIAFQSRETILTWSDAASTKGLGGYYTSEAQPSPQPDSIFSIALPSSIAHASEHINTKEMRGVEQVLLYWGRGWKGKQIVIHTVNRAVAHGLANGTIRGESMRVLRRCLLLAVEWDLELRTRWISTTYNALADALSRFDYQTVTNLAPQLSHPAHRLPSHGLRTYSNRDCHL